MVAIFKDEGISGTKGRDRRPGLDALLKGVARREFDIVAACSVCRLGRSLSDLIGLPNELRSREIDLYLHQQALDTSTQSGRMLFGMLGVFSEFERAMIRDRVLAGLDRARSSGKRLGRPRTTDLPRRTARHQDRFIAPSLVGTGLLRDPVPTEDRRCGVPQFIWRDADHRLSQDVAADRQAGRFPGRHHAACAAPQLFQSCRRSGV